MAKSEIEDLRNEVEQLRVQLAGCLTAAEGGRSEDVSQGDYGWSLAFEQTRTLHARYERLKRALEVALPHVKSLLEEGLIRVVDTVQSEA